MYSFNGECVYVLNGKSVKVRFSEKGSPDGAFIRTRSGDGRLAVDAVVPSDAVFVSAFIDIRQAYSPDSFLFSNGYQSWTDTQEFRCGERTPSFSLPSRLLDRKYAFSSYGDYTFVSPAKRGEVVSHGYTYVREGAVYSLSGSLCEDGAFTVFRHRTRKGGMRIERDCEGMSGGTVTLFDIFFAQGDAASVHDRYFSELGCVRSEKKKAAGWTSWYNYYQNISEEIILRNLDNYSSRNLAIDIFQIDDGYQRFVGDWLDVRSDRFPGGMRLLSDRIHDAGYKAGLWLAPFSCETDSALYKAHPGWVVRDAKGLPLKAGGNWSGFYALDIYNADVRAYLKKVFDTVTKEWGFDLVKLDFLYCVCLVPRNGKTRGRIMADAMALLRELLPSTEILGCGVPLASAFGRVEYCRIGCDLDLKWSDGYMRFFHRERVSTVNALINTMNRRHLDGRAFLNDPDVVMLRDANNGFTEDEKETILTVNTMFGSVFFTSDDISLYGDAVMSRYERALGAFRAERTVIAADESDGVFAVRLSENGAHKLLLVNMNGAPAVYEPDAARSVLRAPDGNFVQGTIRMRAHQSAVFDILPIQQEEI